LSITLKLCVYKSFGIIDADVNEISNQAGANPRRINYWRLWLFDTVLVSAGILFFLALQYGTYEFFGKACVMALLPLIPVMVLVGGAGSTVFALTKVWIEKRALPWPTALALLVGPALVVTLLLVLLGARQVARTPAGLHLSGERTRVGKPCPNHGLFNLPSRRMAGRVHR
jgi:hypothetical protein